MPTADSLRPPTDAEIGAAEKRLGRTFHSDYRAFLRGGGDVANAVFEAAVVLPGGGHLDLFEMAQRAWSTGVPKDLLPFVEDNANYFCITDRGEIVCWSHDGATSERWPSLAAWHRKVCVERK